MATVEDVKQPDAPETQDAPANSEAPASTASAEQEQDAGGE